MRKRFYQSAFSLIELLVVISIIGLLSTIGIAGYNRFNNQQILRQTKNEVKTAIRQAVARAKNNEKDCTVCGGSDNDCATFVAGQDAALNSWHLEIDSGVRIFGECTVEFGSQTIDTSGATITPDLQDIEFYPPAAGGGSSLSSPLTLTFSRAGANDETITINPSGNVE